MFKKLLHIGLTTFIFTLFLVISGVYYVLDNTDLFDGNKTSQNEKIVVIDTNKVEVIHYDTVKVKIQKVLPKQINVVKDTTPPPSLDTLK